MRAQILIFDGFDELDALGPYEVLALAARRGGPFEVGLATLERQESVRGDHGTEIRPHGVLEPVPDLIVVPGGGWSDFGPSGGARAEAERGDLPRALARRHERGSVIASVCTGGMLLGAAGLLDGRPATTHHTVTGELARMGAVITDARVVDDGDVITSGGVTSGLDLALWIVEREAGPHLAAAVADEIEHERRGEVRRRG
ncbi:MAG: DJ-1/PfpI family protein [Thermoleophilia bacterium]